MRIYLYAGMLAALGCSVTGMAIARERPLELKSADQRLTAPLNVESLSRLTRVALTGTPSELGGFVPAFDRHLDTSYKAREAGTATLDLAFRDPQTLHNVILYLGEGRYRWSAAAADSIADLNAHTGSYRELVPDHPSRELNGGDEFKLPDGITYRALRFTIVPESKETHVVVRELLLTADQKLEALAVEAPSQAAPVGERMPLRVTGFFSGGESRELAGSGLNWTVNPPAAARVDRDNRLVARRRGSFNVQVQYDRFTSTPLGFNGVDAD
jgi:hypothetical protein